MTEKERAEVIQTMAENMDLPPTPKVGIFWYDPESDELFGVDRTDASLLPFNSSHKKTHRILHKAYWQKQYFRKNRRFMGDYTRVPRGRVFEYQGEGFKVMVGNWINDYPNVRELILDEFELPRDTEFIIDSHWDLGHGWAEEFLEE